MANITFNKSPGSAWVVAGWAFRQILGDTIREHSQDPEMAEVLNRARDVGYLYLPGLGPVLAERAAAALEYVAQGILAGTIESGIMDNFGDELTKSQYLAGLHQLIEATRQR